jgi:HEAT repeat protein
MKRILGALLAWAALAPTVKGYIDVTPTLGRLINDSSNIVVLRVEKVHLPMGAILFQKVADLKGHDPADKVKHKITAGLHPREPATVLEWAEPGQLAIGFRNGNVVEICLGRYWYECYAGKDDWWFMTCGQAQLSFAYSGSVARLRDHVAAILDGKEVVITAVKYSADDAYWRTCKRVVAMRDVPQGSKFPICRFKASLRMPVSIYQMGRDPTFVVELGAAAREDIPRLVATLKDLEWQNRLEATQALGQIGPAGPEVVAALRLALQDPKSLVRIGAAEALMAIDPAQEEARALLIELLSAPEAKVRKRATQALGSAASQTGAAVPALQVALRDKDAQVRSAAADALGRFGPKAAKAAPALIEAVQDPDPAVCNSAIDALGSIGPMAKAALPLLTRLLQDGDNPLRWTAAVSLFHIDRRQARAGIPVLIEKLTDKDTKVRWHALYYLRKMAQDGKETIPLPLLLEAMKDADLGVRGMTAGILGDLGPKAEAAVPALVKALEVDDTWLRSVAASALVRIIGIKATAAIPALIEGLSDDDEDIQEDCLQALQRLGPVAKEAKPALLRLAKNEALRWQVAETIWRVTLEPRAPVQLLIQALSGDDRQARRNVLRVLGEMGPEAMPAVPALNALLQQEDPEIRAAALESLSKIAPEKWPRAAPKPDGVAGLTWRLTAWALLIVAVIFPIAYWARRQRPGHAT